MLKLSSIALLLVLVSSAEGQNFKLAIPKAGEVEIRHGAVRYRPELYEQATVGMTWRMGSGGATILKTKAALVWPNGVIFPGDYNLAMRKVDDDRWDLLVHRDGVRFENKAVFGTFPMRRTQLPDKQATKDLVVSIKPSDDKAERALSGYEFHVQFGPHDTSNALRGFGAGKLKLKIGKIPVEAELVKLPALPDYERFFGAETSEAFTFAQLHIPGREQPVRLAIAGGETPILKFLELQREVEGRRAEAKPVAKTLKVAKRDDVLTLALGAFECEFTLSSSLLEEAAKGGSTGR